MTAQTVLPRTAWTSQPAASPGALVDPRGLAVHWVGPAVPAAVNRGERHAVALFLEAIRRTHVLANGWSDIAYQEAVDQAGRRWKLRGWGRRSAANGDTVPNARYGAVVALLGQGQHPTEAMLRGLASARADFRRVHPTGDRLVTHNDVRPEPTACPGPDLTRWVHQGGRPPGPTPPPLPTPEELLTMKLSDKITIPPSYPSNQRKDNKPEEVTVETLLRRIYDWSYRAAFPGAK